jgi:hypothetical protein
VQPWVKGVPKSLRTTTHTHTGTLATSTTNAATGKATLNTTRCAIAASAQTGVGRSLSSYPGRRCWQQQQQAQTRRRAAQHAHHAPLRAHPAAVQRPTWPRHAAAHATPPTHSTPKLSTTSSLCCRRRQCGCDARPARQRTTTNGGAAPDICGLGMGAHRGGVGWVARDSVVENNDSRHAGRLVVLKLVLPETGHARSACSPQSPSSGTCGQIILIE